MPTQNISALLLTIVDNYDFLHFFPRSVWVVRFTYAGFAVVAFTVIPIYAELLKIGE